MSQYDGRPSEVEAIGKKLRAVRLIQDLYLEADSYWQLPGIFAMILRALDDVLGFKHSMIYLINDDGDKLMFQSCWGYPDGHLGPSIQVGHGFIGVAARTGKVLRVGDLRKVFLYTKAIRARTAATERQDRLTEPVQMPGLANPESLIAVPLRAKTGIIGVIVVESPRSAAFDELDQDLLLLVAGQTAQLIEEVRWSERLRRQHEGLRHAQVHLEQLNRFLDAVTASTGMSASATYAAAMAKQMKGIHCAETDSDQARTYFDEAADIFQQIGLSLESVRSKLSVAVLTLVDQPVEAVQMLHECQADFEACGAIRYADLTRTMIASLTRTDHPLQSLTRREREVAVLVAQGYSNAEIAGRLYVSVRTVTTHLERIYDKLELQSRSALARVIASNT